MGRGRDGRGGSLDRAGLVAFCGWFGRFGEWGLSMAIGVSVVLNGGKNRIVQARTVRRDGWTAARREEFLLALSMTANVTTAAIGVGITPSGAHALRRREPVFAAMWAEALASGYDRLEEALLTITLAGLRGEPAAWGEDAETAGDGGGDGDGGGRGRGDGDGGGVKVGAVVPVAEGNDAVSDDAVRHVVPADGAAADDAPGDDAAGDDAAGDDVGGDGGAGDDIGGCSGMKGGGAVGGAGGGGAVGGGGGDGGVATVASGAAGCVAPMPGFGAMRLTGPQAVQVGLSMLARFRAAQAGGGGGKRPQHRRATVSETNVSIAKKLDSLAQRLRASSVEGEA